MNIKKTISSWFDNLKYFLKYSPMYLFVITIVSVITGAFPIIITYFSREVLNLIDYTDNFSRIIYLVILIVIFRVTLEITILVNKLITIHVANKINIKIKEETLKKIRKISYTNFYDDLF